MTARLTMDTHTVIARLQQLEARSAALGLVMQRLLERHPEVGEELIGLLPALQPVWAAAGLHRDQWVTAESEVRALLPRP
jgi:hypothetical protein